MKKYPSKISYSLVIIILAIIIGSAIPLVSPPIWPGLLINIMVLVFISHLLLNTYYVIDGNFLVVKSGFVVNKKIDINTIIIVSETNSIISAPAASFDRLEIVYKQHNSILISPRDKTEFIDHIKRINPKIEIQYKSRKIL
ncbi:PH domain-containing protein [Eudoraea adriatica]|uniref:PH domain-containing protein n=1 Tax=Eudoraea adriatica TaxID=446681 RepID=UPI00036957F2|nr:PH domain-containing protein [Eudoraea adriatica]